jgi:hypothetical protein
MPRENMGTLLGGGGDLQKAARNNEKYKTGLYYRRYFLRGRDGT